MPLNYYIDESGNTGDILSTGNNFDFYGQPVFSLACVDIDESHNVEKYILDLKKKYRIQGIELKSSNIIKNKIEFIIDLISYIREKKIPIFIEVVDKKYYLSANIVNCHVMPPYSSPPETEESMIIRNHCADYIYENAPTPVFMKFIEACRSPSSEKLLSSFDEIRSFATNYKPISALSVFVLQNIEESMSDFEELKNNQEEMAFRRFIPVPDDSKRNKSIWMLPNLASFTNIYARINLFQGESISNVNIYHDEQAHFDEIILNSKKLAEDLNIGKTMPTPNASYEFSQAASMSFVKSHDCIPIQVADILAGVAMRYVQENICGKKIGQNIATAFNEMLYLSNPARGVGVNMIITSKLFQEINC